MPNQNKNLKDDLTLAADLDPAPTKERSKSNSNKTSAPLASSPRSELGTKAGRAALADLAQVKEETVSLAKSKMILAKKLLNNIKENNERLLQLLSPLWGAQDEAAISIGQLSNDSFEPGEETVGESKIIEGVFDGESMIGPDGKQYNVPANYASKSKLVEGDILKLTITASGTFIYKQIGPIERARVVGALERGVGGEYFALADGKRWRLLTASVTYFKGEVGDEAVILVPKNGESKWAAVENIVRKTA
jgi:hypothetical protein